jgi:hypothetical protein
VGQALLPQAHLSANFHTKFSLRRSLLAPRLKLQPEPNNLGTPQIKSITIDIRKQNIPMQTMETQRRGAQNTATLHCIPASYGCLWIEIL